MEDSNLAVLVDAKTEYTNQLVSILQNNIYTVVNELFTEAKLTCFENNEHHLVYKNFQDLLSNIPNWTEEKIKDEANKIIINSKCDWIDDLITAVFVSHTKILTSVNKNKPSNKISLKIPKTTHFIHECFIESARHFWKNAYLFDDSINNFQYQKNRKECDNLIEKSITDTIRKELPLKNILNEYLENENTKESNNLKSIILKEIQECSDKQKNNEINKKLKKSKSDSQIKLSASQDIQLEEKVIEQNTQTEENVSVEVQDSVDEPVPEPEPKEEEPVPEPEPKEEEPIPEPEPKEEEPVPESDPKEEEPVPEPEPKEEEPVPEPEPEEEEPVPEPEPKEEAAVPEPEPEPESKENILVKLNEEDNKINLDNLINEQLEIENLNLEDMNNLESLEEIYLDENNEFAIDNNSLNNSNNSTSIKKVVINKNKKKNSEYSFFS